MLFLLGLLLLAQPHQFKYERVQHPRAKGFVRALKRERLEKWIMPPIKVVIPNTLDLRPMLSPIEDQGDCGSCWSFSLTATLRDSLIADGKDPGRLSQQYLVSCAKDSYGCDGGDFSSAKYFVNPKGAPDWNQMPYSATNGKCIKTLPKGSIGKWGMFEGNNGAPSQKQMIEYMVAYKKPLSVTVAAGAGLWEGYKSGIYNACVSGRVDHMINLIGFDCEGSCVFDKKGALPKGKGYWILRNSWGTGWGERGFIRMKMTDTKGNRCNSVAEEACYFLPKK